VGGCFAALPGALGRAGRWAAGGWAAEGAGVCWVGWRRRRPLARAGGLLRQLGSALAFLSELRIGEHSLLTGAPLGALLLGAALLFSFAQLRKASAEQAARWERKGQPEWARLRLSCWYLLAPVGVAGPGSRGALGHWRCGEPVTCAASTVHSRPVHPVSLAIRWPRVLRSPPGWRGGDGRGGQARSRAVSVTDAAGRWTRAGAEVTLRVGGGEAGGLPAYVSTRLVPTGGGYSSQGAAPVHFGNPEGLARVDVVAHSMGGMLAVRLARNAPTRVNSLVLEAPIGQIGRAHV